MSYWLLRVMCSIVYYMKASFIRTFEEKQCFKQYLLNTYYYINSNTSLVRGWMFFIPYFLYFTNADASLTSDCA